MNKVMHKRSCFQILAGVIDNIAQQITRGTKWTQQSFISLVTDWSCQLFLESLRGLYVIICTLSLVITASFLSWRWLIRWDAWNKQTHKQKTLHLFVLPAHLKKTKKHMSWEMLLLIKGCMQACMYVCICLIFGAKQVNRYVNFVQNVLREICILQRLLHRQNNTIILIIILKTSKLYLHKIRCICIRLRLEPQKTLKFLLSCVNN